MFGNDASGPRGWPDDPPSIRDALNDTVDFIRDRAIDTAEPVWDWVRDVAGTFIWVLERVELLTTIRIFAWQTAGDERTCPECGPLDGQTWDDSTPMPSPPLHTNCRCRIVLAATDIQSRWVDEWRYRWVEQETWQWRQTGWA